MRLPRADWSRWLVASGIAILSMALVLPLFRVPAPEPTSAEGTAPARVTMAPESDPALTEEAMLRDPTPLFLPTRWNATENALPSGARPEPGTSFRDFPPAWRFAGAELELRLPLPVEVPASPAGVLTVDKSRAPLNGFGLADREITPLAPRGAFVRVSSAAGGQVVLARPLDASPPGEAVWQPLEFLIAVEPAGLVRPPVLTESSRVAAVDGYFQDYLAKSFHVGARLPPGFYRVSIGP